MENFKKYLILAKDNSDLKEFAKRQETIFQLEDAKSDAFNISGPTSCHYIRTSNKLYDLYFEEEDYEEALDIAKEVFDIVQTNPDVKLKSEAIVNLGMAYLKNGNITSAKNIANTYSFDDKNPKYPQYCLFKASLAQTYKNKEEEIDFLQKAYRYSIENNDEKSVSANILLAIAQYYERNEIYHKAYMAYLEIFNKASEIALSLNEEERFSFLLRLANLASINHEKEFALDLLNKCKKAMTSKLKENHPLMKIIDKALKALE